MATRIRHVSVSTRSFHAIEQLDTCLVSNAIERLKARLRNEGFVRAPTLHCLFPDQPPMLGYAVTGRIRSSSAPVDARCYHENMNWWRYLTTIPEPRIMVLEDVDKYVGSGALVGELHAAIGIALNCRGFVTNGSVRDLPAVEAMGFHLFAGSVSVTHQYAHVAEYGLPVELGGLTISPGDLIHGDRHGVHSIPFSVVEDIPRMASCIKTEERELVEYCRSKHFSVEGLDRRLQASPGDGCEVRLV